MYIYIPHECIFQQLYTVTMKRRLVAGKKHKILQRSVCTHSATGMWLECWTAIKRQKIRTHRDEIRFLRVTIGYKRRWPIHVTARSKDLGPRPFVCWDCGFESRRGSVSICSECCVLSEVSASGYSLVQRIPNECGVFDCDQESSTMRRSRPTGAVEP